MLMVQLYMMSGVSSFLREIFTVPYTMMLFKPMVLQHKEVLCEYYLFIE